MRAIQCGLCVTATLEASDASTFYADNCDGGEHLSLGKGVPREGEGSDDDVRWNLLHWGAAWDVQRVEYHAEAKQRYYTFVAIAAPPLKWQRAVARKYPNLDFVLSFHSADCDLAAGYVSYSGGRLVGQHGDDACLRPALVNILAAYDAERHAVNVIRPVLALWVQHRLYRHPDGLRLAALRAHFEDRAEVKMK
ncbi:hypothetical protein CTAYLR_008599 [Chrysophaeum taylorii]|uniref:YubB ferredoxin-like domain-containing protein n=1 Tax=Chrysophaeum taylorii TaxID=2483200 RepID=A0AAD7UIV8_9STRA|nr:hypothetical protein CTAYLR_008599 [Chrysophaeum taylorii]